MDEVQLKELHRKHAFDNLVFQVVTGSTSYGLDIEGSDEDLRGAFVQHPKYVLGLDGFEEYRDEPIHYAGLKKWGLMLAEGKPNYVELLFGEPYYTKKMHPLFAPLVEKRQMFLTKQLLTTGVDMGKGLGKRKSKAQEGAKSDIFVLQCKQAMHALRVVRTMRELVSTGVFRVYRPGDRELLLPIRLGQVDLEDVGKMVLDIADEVDDMTARSSFPNQVNRKEVDDIVVPAITEYWKEQGWA